MEIKNISPADFAALYQEDKFSEWKLIDVREPHEWEAFHLKKACLIPMNTIPEQLERLAKDQPLFILCAHGVRSVYVSQYLVQHGYKQVVNVEGGMAAVYGLLEKVDREE